MSGSFLLPALVAFGSDEFDVGYRFLLYAALGGFFSIGTLLAIFGRIGELSRDNAIRLAVFSWAGLPLIAAVPLMDVGSLDLVQAIFQSYSSVTTTGAVVFDNLDAVPKSVIVFLAMLQWLGGIATLITVVLVLAPWEIGGLPQVDSASVAASIVASHTRLVRFCWKITQIMLAMTLVCIILLLISGVAPYEALIMSFTAVSTGGVLPTTESPDLMLGNSGMIIFALFLILGSCSIFWIQSYLTLDFRSIFKHRESYFIIAVWVVLAIFIAINLILLAGSAGVLAPQTALVEGLFNARVYHQHLWC